MHCAIYQYDSIIFNRHEQVKEFVDPYHRYTMEEKLNRAKENPEHRFVYFFEEGYTPEGGDLQELKDLSSARENIVYMFDKIQNEDISAIPHFYTFEFAALTLDDFKRMAMMEGITDIYITGEVCFRMSDVKILADKYKVKVRMVPNYPQGLYKENDEENIVAFWVRPEDLHLYDPYVDVVEFICRNIRHQRAFYEVYFEDRRWEKPLDILIPYLDGIHNQHIPIDFTEARLNCGKRCVLDRCHLCHSIKALTANLYDNQLEIDYPEEERKLFWIPEEDDNQDSETKEEIEKEERD